MAQWMLFVVLALLALAAWEAWKIHMGLESRAWEHTTGVIAKVWVEDMPDVDPDVLPLTDEEGTHSVHAHYRYKVGARWYHSRRLSYRTTQWIRFGAALDMIHGMRAGREVDVFYDPRKPGRAVLIPGSSTANVVLLGTYLVTASLFLFQWMR